MFGVPASNIAGAVGLGVALDYLADLGLDAVGAHEHEVLDYATEAVKEISGLRIIGQAPKKSAILSFVLDGIHAHDIGTIVDREGVAIRVGHHCTMPLMKRYGVPATARASLALYNTKEDIDSLVSALVRTKELFAR